MKSDTRSNAFNALKDRITSKDFRSFSEARFVISKSLVNKEISNEEHTELRLLLTEIYKD